MTHIQILNRIRPTCHPKSDLADLKNVRPPVAVGLQHESNELMHCLRIFGIVGYREVSVLNRQRALAKRQGEEAELVEKAPERPNIGLRRDGLAERVQIDHLGRAIRQRRVLLNLLLDHRHAMRFWIQNLAGRTPEIT